MGNCKVAITIILIATLSALSHGLKTAVTGDKSIDLCHLNRSLTKTLKVLLYAEQNILLMYKRVDFLKSSNTRVSDLHYTNTCIKFTRCEWLTLGMLFMF